MNRLLIILLLLAIPLLAYGCWRSLEPTIGTAVTAAEAPISGLPESATDVRYFLAGAFGPSTYYEFQVSEAEFEAWTGRMKFDFTRDGSGKFYALKEDGRPHRAVEIEDGIILWWRDPNNSDSGVAAAYDRSTGRAYYHMHTR